MDKNKLWKWLLLGFLLLWSVTLVLPPMDQKDEEGHIIKRGKVKLGLDLQGGSSFVVQVDVEDVKQKMVERFEEIQTVDDISASQLKAEISNVQESAVEMIRNPDRRIGPDRAGNLSGR